MRLKKIIVIWCSFCLLYSAVPLFVSGEKDSKKSQTVGTGPLTCGRFHCRNKAMSSVVGQMPSLRSKLSRMLYGSVRLGGRVVGGIKRLISRFMKKVIVPVSHMKTQETTRAKVPIEITPIVKERIIEVSSLTLFDQISLVKESTPQINGTCDTPIATSEGVLYASFKENIRRVTEIISGYTYDTLAFLGGYSVVDDFKHYVSNLLEAITAVVVVTLDQYTASFLLSVLILCIAGTYLLLLIIRYIAPRCRPLIIAGKSCEELAIYDETMISSIAPLRKQLKRGYADREEEKEECDENDSLSCQLSKCSSSTLDSSNMVSIVASSSDDIEDNGANLASIEQEHLMKQITELEVDHLTDKVFDQSSSAVIPVQQLGDALSIEGNDDNGNNSFVIKTIFETLSSSVDSLSSTHVSPSFTPAKPVITTSFHCINPFDENGVIVYLTSKIKNDEKKSCTVRAKMSTIFMGSDSIIIAHGNNDLGLHSIPNYTKNEMKSWCAIDLGTGRRLIPNQYCIRHGASSTGNALRNWELRAREKDTDRWNILKIHINDEKLSDIPTSVALWDIGSYKGPPVAIDKEIIPSSNELNENDNRSNHENKIDIDNEYENETNRKGYRYFLILQTDVNSSGNNCLFIGGIDFYGLLTEKISHQVK